MRIAIDTNRYSDLVKGDEAVAEIVSSADEVWVPVIVVAELRAGFAAGAQHGEMLARIQRGRHDHPLSARRL